MKKIFILSMLALVGFKGVSQSNNQIKFTAKIANRNSDTIVIKGANNFRQVIPINKLEVFDTAFEAQKGFYRFSDGVESSTLFLKPGSEVNLTMDAKEFDETIVYKGKGTDESNFLAQQALKDEKFQNEAFAKNESEFSSLLKEKSKSDLANLEKSNFDTEFKDALKKSFEQFNEYAVQEYKNASKMNSFVGKASPGFDFENYAGGKTKLSDLKGKYVYIDIWATWCGPCRAEIPFLQKIEEKYHGKNIHFVSLSIDKATDHEKWKKFVLDKKLGGIQLFADKDWQSDFVLSYGVTGIPRFILIDPQGNIVDADADRPSSGELKARLDVLLQ